MTDNQKTIVSQVKVQLRPNTVIDEDLIRQYIQVFKKINPVSEEEEEEIVRELHSCLDIRMDRGNCIREKNHVPWYYNAKKNIIPKFWDRFRLYQIKNQGINPNVINALDSSTDEMMDMLGNPNLPMEFFRSGLVIGDIQSGKTATYTALINKAADAGYKIIILLTGTIEKLRRQTQSRLDAGFIGLDSTALIRDKDNVLVGVGEIDPSVDGWAITSTSSDFNTNTAKQFNGKLSGISSPVLFVLKKNKSVLEHLEQWLRMYNADPVDGKIPMPMILIDDEADNASVNTNKPDESPTVINGCIRRILKLFARSNYVAFTATPYANIFINPDSQDEMLGDELFPKDFIYALEAPTNYIGARTVFPQDGKYNYMLKCNNDCEYYIPEKHKKDFVPTEIPGSMKEAILSFFIANAIRDLRGHTGTHRSMLINVSRFINVQERLRDIVDSYVREVQREIKNYCLTGSRALEHEYISCIKDVYNRYFVGLPDSALDGERRFSWEEIQLALPDAVASVVVRTVNGRNASKNLNYDECEDEGLRVIAIGGISLSRGLTLEGLCTSYFYRNSKMYDTLMQMGRWFGYRDHYADVCQIWMSDTSADWYSYISEASDELRREVRKINDLGLTPREFGLGVRSDKDALLVTAVNKMRYTHEIPMAVSLDGEVIETPYLFMNKEANSENYILVTNWIEGLLHDGYMYADTADLVLKHPQILRVPVERITELLSNYRSHYLNMNFMTENLVQLMQNSNDNTLSEWDVLIASGTGIPVDFCGNAVRPIRRSFSIRQDKDALQMSGRSSRLGNTSHGMGGLNQTLRTKIEDRIRILRPSTDDSNKNFSQEDYFKSGIFRRPLLTIYPIELSAESRDKNGRPVANREKQKLIDHYDSVLIGMSIGIPSVEGKEKKTFLYRINLVKWRDMLDVGEDFSEETGVDDE